MKKPKVGDRVQNARHGWAVVTGAEEAVGDSHWLLEVTAPGGPARRRHWPRASIVAVVRARPGQVVDL